MYTWYVVSAAQLVNEYFHQDAHSAIQIKVTILIVVS